jgi:hypothetical protein
MCTNKKSVSNNTFKNAINDAYQKMILDKDLGFNFLIKITGNDEGLEKPTFEKVASRKYSKLVT